MHSDRRKKSKVTNNGYGDTVIINIVLIMTHLLLYSTYMPCYGYVFVEPFVLLMFQWARYMRCDGSPNPTTPGEINTYINLRLEDDKHNDIDSVLKQGELDLSVIYHFFLYETTQKDK